MNFYKGKFDLLVKSNIGRNEMAHEVVNYVEELNKKCINANNGYNVAFLSWGNYNFQDNRDENFEEIMNEITEGSKNYKYTILYYIKTNKQIKDFKLFKNNIEKIALSEKIELQLDDKAIINNHNIWGKKSIEIYDEVISNHYKIVRYLYNGIMDEKDIPFIDTYYNNDNIIQKYNLNNYKLKKDRLIEKHSAVLKNEAFMSEISRAYSITDKIKIQGVNYLFNEKNSQLRKKQYEAIADMLYANGRLVEPTYYIVQIDVWKNDLNAFLIYLKNRIKIANNSLYFFEFEKITQLNNDPFHSSIFSPIDVVNDFCENLKNNQFFTTFGFYIGECVEYDFENLSEKELTENFSLVVFNNKMNEEAQVEYVKMKLESINHIDLLPAMKDIIKLNSDDNDGHTTTELDDYINSLLKDKYDRIYKKAYKDITMEMRNGNITEKLMNMVGLHNLKKAVSELKNRVKFKDLKENLLPVTKALSKYANVERNNWILAGSPGTGKSRAAEILEKVMYQEKIITKDLTVKYTPSYQNNDEDSMSSIFGTSNSSTIKDSFVQAVGGVLIVDEIGHLSAQDKSLLLQLMEDNKKSVSVILCGYEKEVQDFLNYNAGFRSRFTHIIHMEDYTLDELFSILENNLKKSHFFISDNAKLSAKNLINDARAVPNFGQARFIESLAEKLISIHSNRKLNDIEDMLDRQDDTAVNTDDIYEICKEDIENVPVAEMLGEEYNHIKRFGDPYDELQELIGCNGIKTAIREYVSKAQVDLIKLRKKLIKRADLNMNMVFYGAPGTAKTTVARLVARILYDKGMISSPEVVEVGAKDLVAAYVGQTAIKTANVFESARNKVLFIDEAYSLANKDAGGYNQEAIDTIIREMENHRSDTMVIFAGYKKPMQEFISCNPGFKSRISKYIDFENYSMDELKKIFLKLTKEAGYSISKNSEKKILDIIGKYFENHMNDENFGNGRECRTILENAITKQSQRIVALDEKEQDEKIMTLEFEDFNFDTNDFNKNEEKTVGFTI